MSREDGQTQSASMEVLAPLMMERLAVGQSVRFTPKGTSMLPMLRHGKDTVMLSPLPARLKKYDLPLYQRDNGQYVLHRVIRVGDDYTCMGDNQFVPEPGLRHDQMIGLVTAFSRKGKEYTVQHPGYRLYCRVWYHTRHARHLFRRGIAFIRRRLP